MFALIGTLIQQFLVPISLSDSSKSQELIVEEKRVELVRQSADEQAELVAQAQSYLESQNSPLAKVTPHILAKKHWRLIIGISAIESQFCTRKLYLNCWGIGGDFAYRHYPTLEAGVDDVDALISHWQAKGKWLTPRAMNCSYVVPCNENWVKTVNSVISDLDAIVQRTTGAPKNNAL